MSSVPAPILDPLLAAGQPSLESLFPKVDLRETDGEPLDSPWHRAAINLLIECVLVHFRGRTDFYAGGNMFIYYSERQARTLEYRGPDFFFVKGVDGTRPRRYWLLYEEEGKYPDVITELLSPSTAKIDRTTKKTLYEQTFRTAEYFLYDPDNRQLEGWRHDGKQYQAMVPGENGRLWSEELGLWVGTWEGTYQKQNGTWVRFFDSQGQLVPTEAESEKLRAESEKQRAESEHKRAESLRAEVARLTALLAEKVRPPAS
jgi:Uma2 family endonuclease